VSILVSWHEPLFDEVTAALDRHLNNLSRGDLARESLEKFGAFIQVADMGQAAGLANLLAPEHLHVQTRDPEPFADRIDDAGTIFLGHYTPVALGDYAAGPSHVLPTAGTARFASGLTANDFLRRSSVISFTRNGLRDIADDVVVLAQKEGLTAHAASVSARLRGDNAPARPPKKSEKVKK
jgi:histidinol dehydrogenase